MGVNSACYISSGNTHFPIGAVCVCLWMFHQSEQTGSVCRSTSQQCNKLLHVCRDGKVIPWDLVKRGIEATHPYSVFMVRSMLAVPFFEKAVYELPEDQVTPEQVTALADSIEKDVEGGLAGRSA